MTARAVGRVVLIGAGVGLLALVAAASDLAAVWAVPIGVAVSILGEPPAVRRGVATLLAGLVTVALLGAATGLGASQDIAAGLTVGVLVVLAGLLRLRDEVPAPAWTVLVGGATVLAGAQVAGGAHLADVAPALGGLILGLLPMQIGEVVVALRRDDEQQDDEQQPSVAVGEERP
jgi:hypothetical protein